MSEAIDILPRIDQETGVNVNYRQETLWYDGTPMTDLKCDGVIYRKKGSVYYKRQFEGLPKSSWFGNEIDKAMSIFKDIEIDNEIDLGGGELQVDGHNFIFNTGKLSNGVVKNLYSITADDDSFIFDNVVVSGLSEVNAAWFGCNPLNADNSSYLTNALTNPDDALTPDNRTIVFGKGLFQFSSQVNVGASKIIGKFPVQKINGYILDDYKTNFKYNGDGIFLNIKGEAPMAYGHATFYMENIYIEGNVNTNPNCMCINTERWTSLNILNCEIRKFNKALNLKALINTRFKGLDLGYNKTAIYFQGGSTISTSTFFDSCYLYENDFVFQNEPTSVLDVHFNKVIFESSVKQVALIDPTGFEAFNMIDCYSENNNKGTDSSGTGKKSAEFEVLNISGITSFKLTSISNNFGGNNFGNLSDLFLIKSGSLFSYGDRITRYTSAINIDDSGIGSGKINIDFNSIIVSGGIVVLNAASVISRATRSNMNVRSYAPDNRSLYKVSQSLNISPTPNVYPTTGVSADLDVSETREASVLKGQNGLLHIYQDNILSFGAKRRIGVVTNSFSMPVKSATQQPTNSGSDQVFIQAVRDTTQNNFVGLQAYYSPVLATDLTQSWNGFNIPFMQYISSIPANVYRNVVYYHTGWNRILVVNSSGVLVDYDGYPANRSKGTTAERPTGTAALEGFEYYDSDLKKKILYNGTAWVNVNGTAL